MKDFAMAAPLVGAPAIRPSSRLPFRLGFCSHRFEDFPWFDPFYCSIADAGRRRALRQFKRAHGITGIVLCRRYDYDANEVFSGLDGRTMLWPEFRPFLDECVADGLFVWVIAAPDSGPRSLVSGELVQACRELRGYAASLYTQVDWESSRSGGVAGFTSAENRQAILMLREGLGDEALIALHTQPMEESDGWVTGASFLGVTDLGVRVEGGVSRRFFDPETQRERLYWTEADDPSGGDEIGWWYTDAGLQTDILAWQARHTPRGPGGTVEPFLDGEPTWLARLIESAERFLPAGAINYYGNPVRTVAIRGESHPSPFWFGRPRPRGIPVLGAFELAAMEHSRNHISEAHARAITAAVARTGLTSDGCLAV